MCRIYILPISVFVIRVAAFFPFFQGTGFIPPLPFFQRIPWEGIVQMRTILSNEYNNYKEEIESQKRRAEEELDAALTAIPLFIQLIRQAENDPNLTWDQVAERKFKLFSNLLPQQAEVVKFMISLFAPPYAKASSQRMSSNFGHGGQFGSNGIGPFVPVPFGQAPYGQGLYGPKTYGVFG